MVNNLDKTMPTHTKRMDYTKWLKITFTGSFAIFVLTTASLATIAPTLPAWEQTLLWELDILSLLVAFFSPFVFGVVLPLLE
jgi:hypothetical protein